MTVSVADIMRWDPGEVREVFHATRSRAEATFEAADGIATLPAFSTWGGDAADAAKGANERLRKDLDAHGNEATAVARAAQAAAGDVQQVKDDLAQLQADAARKGYAIDPVSSRVIPGPHPTAPMMVAIAEMGELQTRLNTILAEAARVDQELASAINMATGAAPIPATPGEPPFAEPSGGGEDVPAESTGPSVLAGLNHANDRAVLDAMGRVNAAKAAMDEAAASAYTHGPGSPEAQAALARLPQLKQNLADALNALGKIPDYSKIDPNAVSLTKDGHLLFGYDAAGRAVQVLGTLKNGTGELYDQGAQAYYTYKDGKLVGMRFLDEGRAIATPEPLLTAVTTAVGAGPMVKGGQEAWLGLRALFGREGADALGAVTGENVLTHATDLAAVRSSSALDDLAAHGPGAWGPSHEGFGGFSQAYQEFVTGRSISEAYIVEGPKGPVKFDDFLNGALVDAKGNYGQFIDAAGDWKRFFPGENYFLGIADRQIAAAGNTPIVWSFAQESAATKVAEMLQQNGITQITAVWKPMG